MFKKALIKLALAILGRYNALPVPVLVQPKQAVQSRLPRSVFNDFKKRNIPSTIVNSTTTEITAGWLVGINHIINLIEKELTTE